MLCCLLSQLETFKLMKTSEPELECKNNQENFQPQSFFAERVLLRSQDAVLLGCYRRQPTALPDFARTCSIIKCSFMSISLRRLAKICGRGLSSYVYSRSKTANWPRYISTLWGMAAGGINVYRERVAAAPALTHFNEQPSIGIQTNARRR
jgi:hypothetical protein